MVPSPSPEFVPQHETFVAEVRGLDFSAPLSESVIEQLKEGLNKYGVLVFRNTGMDDATYAEFCQNFGELQNAGKPDPRVGHPKLGMQLNAKPDGNVTQKGDYQWYKGQSVKVFHHDASYNPIRAAYTSIKAVRMPPREFGGATQFSDTRTAYQDLTDDMKDFLKDKVACHSKFNTTKRGCGNPGYPPFEAIQPEKYFMGRQRMVIVDPHSKQKSLYIGHHIQHVEGLPKDEGMKVFYDLMDHCEQPKYLWSCYYENPTDVVLWSNLVTMHRAQPSRYPGNYIRELRRAVMNDGTDEQWGLNSKDIERIDINSIIDQHYDEWVAKGMPGKEEAGVPDAITEAKKVAKAVVNGTNGATQAV